MSNADSVGPCEEVAATGRGGGDHPGMGEGPRVWRSVASSAVAGVS